MPLTDEEVDELWRVHKGEVLTGLRKSDRLSFDDTRSWVDPNGYRLSDRLWNQRKAVRKAIDDRIRLGMSRGEDALKVARDVEKYLNPENIPFRGPGGRLLKNQGGRKAITTDAPYRGGRGSYPARRLARTETTRAHGLMTVEMAERLGKGYKWSLSPRHPETDICDTLSSRDLGYGRGVYPSGIRPRYPPHPMCICTLSVTDLRTGGEETDDEMIQRLRQKYRLDERPPGVSGSPSGSVIPPGRRSAVAPGPSPVSSPSGVATRAEVEAKGIEIEDQLRNFVDHEEAAILDPRSGKEIERWRGGGNHVPFSDAQIKRSEDMILIHNHPLGWGYGPKDPRRIGSSFSSADISLVVEANMAEVWAVTPTHRYRLIRPPGGWPMHHRTGLDRFQEISARVRNEGMMKIYKGELTVADGEAAHSMTVLREWSQEFGIEYQEIYDPSPRWDR